MKKLLDIGEERFDPYLDAPYVTAVANAKYLRTYLLEELTKKGIDPETFNRGIKYNYSNEKIIPKTPDTEIYEYQPFFLMERLDGSYTLLDGFRRLIWYDAPFWIIDIRVYKEKDLVDQQIMKLLVYLNHFKFYGGNGSYNDRGFSLAMYTIFGLNIPKYVNCFDSYLSCSETVRKYWGEHLDSDDKISMVKERMINPMFVSDMKFVEELLGTGVMINDIFGALVYKMRETYPDKVFDAKLFLSIINGNKLITDLQGKVGKKGNYVGGAIDQKITNQIVPFYENTFKEMFGGEIIKTYTEYFDEAKTLNNTLKKDTTLTKLTGNKRDYVMDWILLHRIASNIPINFKCVVYPKESDTSSYPREIKSPLPPGLLEIPIVFLKYETRQMTMEAIFGFTTDNGVEYRIRHNYGGYHGYANKYTKIEANAMGGATYKIDLYVDITKEEIDYKDKHRDNTFLKHK